MEIKIGTTNLEIYTVGGLIFVENKTAQIIQKKDLEKLIKTKEIITTQDIFLLTDKTIAIPKNEFIRSWNELEERIIKEEI